MLSHEAREVVLIDQLLDLCGSLRLRNCPLRPTARQEAFLRLMIKEAFFGGAAGGGKSIALLLSGLLYSDVPGYHALLLRPSLTELQLPGGLIDLAHGWLGASKASWSSELKRWQFPGPGRKTGAGGATVGFGYLSDMNDLGRYAGTSYSFLGFDELTQFSEQLYRGMFRVLRQPAEGGSAAAADGTRLTDVPVRIRAASNPGGPGHAWVKDRFVNPTSRNPGAVFLPSRLSDNPHLKQTDYIHTLSELPTAIRARLLHGDWEIPDDGELFQRDWFPLIERHQLPDHTRAVRYWDLAGTEPGPANRDPDWTVGLRLEHHPKSGSYYITDIVRERKPPGAIEQLVATTAAKDGKNVRIQIEQEPGSAGKALRERYNRHVLAGYNAGGSPATGAKEIRARPVAAAAESGLIHIVRGRHTNDFLDELTSFPHGAHDDCIDALAGAHAHLHQRGNTSGSTHVPRGRIPTRPNTSHGERFHTARSLADLAAQLGATTYPSR